ncbi:MAG: hypothetical protein IKC79_02500, partial [Clostridia bacterium]|nr:hypothetical protein [Clostridia bacterium]
GGSIGFKGSIGSSAGEGLTFNKAGMAYAYAFSTPYYSQDFLTCTTGDRKIVLDGYVGSDKYTSVWCLGSNNTWGNTWNWIFGTAVLYDGSKTASYAYINFDNYDISTSNYITTQISGTWENLDTTFLAKNYIRLSYTLPNYDNIFRYCGVSTVISGCALPSLIGLPSSKSNSHNTCNIGLCDKYLRASSEGFVWGISHGGNASEKDDAGLFLFFSHQGISYSSYSTGFRSMLIT